VQPAAESVPVARPYNALSCQEAAAVVSIIRSPQHADESCRELALSLASGNTAVFASHVTVWHYQTLLSCNGPRGRQRERIAGGAHDFDWVSGPNQLWTYDVSYLLTGRRLEYYFLYGLLDFYSRKVVSWLVSDRFVSDEIQRLWDQGLLNEGMLHKPKSEWPQAHSDRGSQMRALPTKVYFQKLGIVQTLSRPQTPNDNPRIEAHFSTVKTLPTYPGSFETLDVAQAYFTEFYAWYDHVHPLTTLHMLTPNQVHSGQGDAILANRGAGHRAAIAARRSTSREPFTIEEVLQQPLPNVSDRPVYSWAGPQSARIQGDTP
jgi:putative transposase